jgi:RNA polymerase sigma-70 factor (ECF subfamily)
MNEHVQSTVTRFTCTAPELHAQLPELLRQGSLEAFAHLVSDYKTPVFQFFQRILADSSVAEESSEKVFLRAYRMRRLLKAGTDLSGWVFRIACDLLRHKDLLQMLHRGVTEEPLIAKAVRALPLQQRIVLLLHRFAGLGIAQIAAALRLTEGAASRLVMESYRALQKQSVRYVTLGGAEA